MRNPVFSGTKGAENLNSYSDLGFLPIPVLFRPDSSESFSPLFIPLIG
jgi:hypothetical protein